MKILTAIFAMTISLPLLAAESPETRILAAAVEETDHLFASVGDPDTSGLPAEAILISGVMVRDDDEVMEAFVRKLHGRVIADELVRSFRDEAGRFGRLPGEIALPHLTGGPFRSEAGDDLWDKLNMVHPEVRAVVILSQPALDSLATVAIVRYEVITRKGFAWGVFQEFEKQPDDTWKPATALVGDIRVPDNDI